MSATTVGTAVARRDKENMLVDWLRDQQADIAMAAASHVKPSAIIRVTQGALRKNDKLMAAAIANPQSLLYCLLDAARLGHEPDTDDYYLVPFGNEVTGIEGYKGIIERMYRAGGVSAVVAEVVRQRDHYRPRGSTTPPLHEFDDFASADERGPMRGAYAYAVMPGGQCSQVVRMGKAEIMEHKAVSRGSGRSDSPWQLWEPAMWKKTVLRSLEPYVPTSTEYRTLAAAMPVPQAPAAILAAQPGPGANGHPVAPEPVYDAEIVEDPADPAPASGAASATTSEATLPDAPGQAARQTRPDDGPSAPAPKAQPAGKAAVEKLDRTVAMLRLGPDKDVRALLEWLCGEPWTATRAQVSASQKWLDDHLEAAQGDADVASDGIWAQYNTANPVTGAGEPAGGE